MKSKRLIFLSFVIAVPIFWSQLSWVKAHAEEPITGPITEPITDTPTQTPTETLTPTLTVTETPTPTLTESPTPTLTLTPTETLTPTMTLTPTLTTSPTGTPTTTITPTVTPTPSPVPGNKTISGKVFEKGLFFFGPQTIGPAEGMEVVADNLLGPDTVTTKTDHNGNYSLKLSKGLYDIYVQTNDGFVLPLFRITSASTNQSNVNFVVVSF